MFLDDIVSPLNELSKDQLKNYIRANAADAVQRTSSDSFKSGAAGDQYNKSEFDTPVDRKRERGMDRALTKLARESSSPVTRLSAGDPIIVTGSNEFKGKTGEIRELSPSGKFVVVDLYNHGQHSMHLSDVEYNQYADKEDELDEAAVNPQFVIAQVTKILAGETRRFTNAPMAQLLAPVMKEYGLTLPQIDAMYPGGLKKAAGEYGIMMKEGFQDFNKVEPYAVCLAGKPVKEFDYYEQARRFHDNWKKKLYNAGDKAKADTITLMPLNLDEAKWDPFTGGDFSDTHDMNHLPSDDVDVDPNKTSAQQFKAMIQYYSNNALVTRALDELYRITVGSGYHDSVSRPEKYLATIENQRTGKTEKRYFKSKQDAHRYAKGQNAVVTTLEKIDNQEDTSDLITLPVMLGLADHKKKWMLKFPSENYAQKWEFKHKNVAQIQWPAGHGLAEGAETPSGQPTEIDPGKYYVWAWDGAVVVYGKYDTAQDAERNLPKIEQAAIKRVGSYVRGAFKVASGRSLLAKYLDKQGVAEAIGKKDLISRLQKDLPTVTDPKNKNADPVNWTGPGKDDYGYTGYQGHGMPTDRAERARIRADKKKGVAEGRSVDANGRTQQDWIKLVRSKFPTARIMQAKMIDGPCHAGLPDGRILSWKKAEKTETLDEIFNPSSTIANFLRGVASVAGDLMPAALVGVGTFAASSALIGPIAAAIAGTTTGQQVFQAMQNQQNRVPGMIQKIIEKYFGSEQEEIEFAVIHAKAAYTDNTEFRWRGKTWPVTLKKHDAEAIIEKNDRYWLEQQRQSQSVSEDTSVSPVTGAITRRILSQRLDLLKQYGPELVGAAVDNVADYVGDVEEIGSSDVSAWVAQVERMLRENPPEAFAEAQTDYQKRRQRERDIDAGKPVARQPRNPQTDYARKRAKEKRDLEQFGEAMGYESNKKYSEVGPHKRYTVYVSKKKFNDAVGFIAVAVNPRTNDAKFKAAGHTQQEAVRKLHAEVDKEIDVATKVSGAATIDFNVDFVREILEMSSNTFYAKIIPGPRLVIAGKEMEQYPDVMRQEGFKTSSIRTVSDSEGATKLPAMPLSASNATTAQLIANGRYALGAETIDRDGNRVFELEFDSQVADPRERIRMGSPAITIGTKREVKESYWAKLQYERNTKVANLITELKESIK